jgi:glutamate 5-kinase
MSEISLRPELPQRCKRVVVKIGSAALANPATGVDLGKIEQIVSDCHALHAAGMEVVLVSSGAIQIGRMTLAQPPDLSVDYLQACSAIGQPTLMACYTQAFAAHRLNCAQVLLTHEDIRSRRRSLNLQNMMQRLLESGVVPILNENDSVSFAEITVGDNDQLAAMVTEMLAADCLVILSTPDGLYEQDPTASLAQVIPFVRYNESFEGVSLVGKTAAGRGGMRTKLEAVRKLTPLGVPVIIATFKHPTPVRQALAGGGTFFEGSPAPEHNARQRWLVSSARLGAIIKIDQGACHALLHKGSLLPSGIVAVEGNFGRGDCVQVVWGRQTVGTGRVEYSAAELRRIQGRQSHEIAEILGYCPAKVAIHRDHLVVREKP